MKSCFHKEIHQILDWWVIPCLHFQFLLACERCLCWVNLLLIKLFIDKAQDAGGLVALESFLFVVAWLYNLSAWPYSNSAALKQEMHLHNQPAFRTSHLLQWGKRCFVLHTTKYCQHYCSITTVSLFSGVSPHSVCVTDPHNSTAVEALLTPQINGECSLAGVSATCCGVYFWSGIGTAFPPVRNTALAPSQIILIPSLCCLCWRTAEKVQI